ncbi:hypothetical protein LSAT2_006520 [Lamellibrachia satsuma]|nr:hypothetical protein LSAT2_006520 [Lamellibrachia satsuma]
MTSCYHDVTSYNAILARRCSNHELPAERDTGKRHGRWRLTRHRWQQRRTSVSLQTILFCKKIEGLYFEVGGPVVAEGHFVGTHFEVWTRARLVTRNKSTTAGRETKYE